MSIASLANQLAYVLNALFWDTKDIEAYKAEHGVVSVKRDLRPDGDPTRLLPAILSYRTRAGYFQTARTFFKRARELTGQRRLADLLDPATVRRTLDTYYRDLQPSTKRTILAAIGKVHQGCVHVGWTHAPSPITDELREHVKAYRDDGNVRQPRFGYIPEDAERILTYLKEHGSKFTLRSALRAAALRGDRSARQADRFGEWIGACCWQRGEEAGGGPAGRPGGADQSIHAISLRSQPVMEAGLLPGCARCCPGVGDPGQRGAPLAR
jgi:hypothetical protein